MKLKAVKHLLKLLGVNDGVDGGDWYNASCPFAPWLHSKGSDSRPSFGIALGKQSHYHCFSCQRSGSLPMLVSNLIMLSGSDNPEARSFVMTHESLELPDYEDVEKHEEPLQIISDKVLAKYEKVPPELKMLAERGISKESVKRWGLRYDRAHYRLVFPIRDSNGMLVGVRGRLTIPSNNPKNPKYLTYKGFSKTDPKAYGVWYGMQHRLAKGKKLILVEGELDAVLLAQALAQRNGVWAAMGASISAEQIKAVQAAGNPVLLFLDDDEAGRMATSKILAKCRQVVPGLFRVKNYQGCKDPAELVEKGLLGEALKSIEHFA